MVPSMPSEAEAWIGTFFGSLNGECTTPIGLYVKAATFRTLTSIGSLQLKNGAQAQLSISHERKFLNYKEWLLFYMWFLWLNLKLMQNF